MNEELLRFMKILKKVPEVKESIEELKFGCYVIDKNRLTRIIGENCDDSYSVRQTCNGTVQGFRVLKENITIIGQVEERHLRMFLWHNGVNMITNGYGEVQDNFREPLFNIDNTLPFMEQSSECYKNLSDCMENKLGIINHLTKEEVIERGILSEEDFDTGLSTYPSNN